MQAWRVSQWRALDQVPRAHSSRRRMHVGAAPNCSSTPMQPADTNAKQMRQTWCRPLSGCAADPASPGGAAAAGAPTDQQTAQLPAVVALGKFDALHQGHRALAAAAADLGGTPWMASFSGMAEVLGWPARLPLVAPCDRQRVLASWAPHCRGLQPRECEIPFAEVRTMSPEAFVELLAAELQAAGVVVGSNYRFGYRAAGTAELLQQLGPKHGLKVRVLGLVGSQQAAAGASPAAAAAAATAAADMTARAVAAAASAAAAGDPLSAGQQEQQRRAPTPEQRAADREEAHAAVSSSRVRHALAGGDMQDAALCLGRPYRLVASLAEAARSAAHDGPALRLPAAALLNQPPAPGSYPVEAALVGASTQQVLLPAVRAELRVDETGLTLAGSGHLVAALPPDTQHLSIDFL